MDIWDKAYETVLKRLHDAGFDVGNNDHLPSGRVVHYLTAVPERTDGGEAAALHLATPMGTARRARERYPAPRTQHPRLLSDIGAYCQGCGRNYNFDPRVLEVDHIRPKSDGGSDAYDNLTLLCPPCNKEKRDRMTLTGLQADNRKNGYLLAENEGNIRHGRGGATGGRRRRR